MGDFFSKIWDWILAWARNFIGIDLMLRAIEEGKPIPAQAYLNLIASSILAVFAILILYKTFYIIVGMIGKSRKFPAMPKDKRYAFLLPARNEELVIGNLIDSIRAMDYPQELIDIYVIADNCTDQTAAVARSKGAAVYEHIDPSKRRKGYALQWFMEEFKKTHDVEENYAYVIMDSDDVCAKSFLSKMNDCMQSGNYDAAIGSLNIKNLDENWISAISGLNIYSYVMTNLRARSIFRSGSSIYGPSSTYRSYLLKDGWDWTAMCEDAESYMDLTAKNCRIGFVEEAEVYDEQPTKFNQLIRQNMRWTRGGLQAFHHRAGPLVKSFFKKPTWTKYDIFWNLFPYTIVTFYFNLTYQIASLILFFVVGDNGYCWVNFLNFFLSTIVGIYIGAFITTALTFLKEWKRIHFPVWKMILYIPLFPLYQVIALPIVAVSVFLKVQWKPITHHCVADANSLEKQRHGTKQ